MQPFVTAHHHKITFSTNGVTFWVEGDKLRLEQVFTNLLANACKYTYEGGLIQISTYTKGNDVIVSIKDNGSGISKEMLTQVFELFAQVDKSLDRSMGGLGIGLTLAKKLVELHKGTLTADQRFFTCSRHP